MSVNLYLNIDVHLRSYWSGLIVDLENWKEIVNFEVNWDVNYEWHLTLKIFFSTEFSCFNCNFQLIAQVFIYSSFLHFIFLIFHLNSSFNHHVVNINFTCCSKFHLKYFNNLGHLTVQEKVKILQEIP